MRHNKLILAIAVFDMLAILFAAGIMLSFALHPPVVERLIIEAGAPLPKAADFIIISNKAENFLSGLPENSAMLGDFLITVGIGKKSYQSLLCVIDTIPPKGYAVAPKVWQNTKVLPADFVRDIKDATAVEVSFIKAPDTSITGTQQVSVLLTDVGGNTTSITSKLSVYAIVDTLPIAPNTDMNHLGVLDFIANTSSPEDERLFTLLTDIKDIDTSIPGLREVIVTLDGEKRRSSVDVLDITPPTATPLHLKKYINDTLTAADFVTNVIDESPVFVSFLVEPDNMLPGEQTVEILLTDAYGNTANLAAKLTLIPDTEPPQIEGSLDKTVFVGDTIAYRAGITVSDNRDPEVALIIDSSAVDAKTAGKYPVNYSATDQAGNTATATGTVTVLSVSREQVYEMADNVLAKILNEDMNPYDKTRAIYDWTKKNVIFISSSPKDDPVLACYRGFRDHAGDCFVIACVVQLLLDQIGIENTMIQRIESARTSSTHYWTMVNVGEGWYHLDASPNIHGGSCFMLTDTELTKLSKRRGIDYYIYDTSLYPAAVE